MTPNRIHTAALASALLRLGKDLFEALRLLTLVDFRNAKSVDESHAKLKLVARMRLSTPFNSSFFMLRRLCTRSHCNLSCLVVCVKMDLQLNELFGLPLEDSSPVRCKSYIATLLKSFQLYPLRQAVSDSSQLSFSFCLPYPIR